MVFQNIDSLNFSSKRLAVSRKERERIKLEKEAQSRGQLAISSFVCKKLNPEFIESLPVIAKEPISKSVLELIFESSVQNKDLYKNKHSFTREIKLLSTYLFLTGGRKHYEFLHKNFRDALPSPSTIRNFLSEKEHHRIELKESWTLMAY